VGVLRWGATVKFGFALDFAAAAALRSAGCFCLHFEIKGFAGYDGPEDEALATLLASFRAARDAGLGTLATLVYGYPTGSADSFRRFIEAMKPHRDALDRWARFKVFRLYRDTHAWLRPAAHGILSRDDPPAGKDLARHVSFATTSGLSSRDFHAAASAALADFRRTDDFPADPVLSDDVWFGAHPYIPPDSPGIGDRIETIGDSDLDYTPIPYAALDKAFRAHVPGLRRPTPEISLDAGPPERLARTADGARVAAIGDGVTKLLRLCEGSTAADRLVPRLAAATRGDGGALLSKLGALGLIRLGRSDDADG